MARIFRTLVISLFVFTLVTACKNHSSSAQTLEIAKKVVTLVEKDQIDDAFEILKLHWPLSVSEVDHLMEHTKKQRDIVKSRYGLPIGVEFLGTEMIGNSMIRHTFIEKFERHALKWQLSFYKPKDQWIINSVYWDDKISELYGACH